MSWEGATERIVYPLVSPETGLLHDEKRGGREFGRQSVARLPSSATQT